MSSRADILRRQLQGRKLVAALRERLGAALGRPGETLEFVPLEETDERYAVFEHRWREASDGHAVDRRFYLNTPDRSAIEQLALTAREAIGDTPLYLFTAQARYCGAVRLSASEVLENVTSLITLDQDDVLACDATGAKGVVCEYFTDAGDETYKFLAWC